MSEYQPFDSGAVTLTDTSDVEVAEIKTLGHPIMLDCEVGAGNSLSSFKIEVKAHIDATYDVWKSGADFSTLTQQMPEIWGSAYPGTALQSTPASGRFKILIFLPGAYAMKVKAASSSTTDTTLRVRAGIYDRSRASGG